MARTAADLELALDVLAGPDEEEAVGWRLDLPPPRRKSLADYRVLMLTHHPLAATEAEIVSALETLAGRLEPRAGSSHARANACRTWPAPTGSTCPSWSR